MTSKIDRFLESYDESYIWFSPSKQAIEKFEAIKKQLEEMEEFWNDSHGDIDLPQTRKVMRESISKKRNAGC